MNHEVISLAIGQILDCCKFDAANLLLGYAKEIYRDFDALSVERSNLLAGATWSYHNQQWLMMVDYALVLDAFLDTEGFWEENKGNLELGLKAIEHLEPGYENRKTVLLHNVAVIYMSQSADAKAQDYFEQSLILERQLGDKLAISRTLNYLGRIYSTRKDFERTNQLYQESLSLGEEVGDERGIAVTLHELGTLFLNQGDYGQAEIYYERSLERYKESAPIRDTASTVHQLGLLKYKRGDLISAQAFFEQALQMNREIAHREGIARGLLSLGQIAYDHGDLNNAQQCWEESARIYEYLGMVDAQTARTRLAVLMNQRELGSYRSSDTRTS